MKTHDNVLAKRELSDAQLKERTIAAHARWAGHRAETNPTVRQAAWGQGSSEPSRAAVALFRQGMPGSSRSNGLWDTRSSEPGVGHIHGRFTLHFPKAYRSPAPDAAPKKLAGRRAAKVLDGAQAITVTNPAVMAEAQRHPEMRAVMQGAVETVRANQKGAIARGTENGLIPVGTPPGLVREAYKHAALLALHKAGLGDWDFRMDDHAKKAFKPLIPFMRYASRRLFDQLNVQHKGKWTAFRDEFGVPFKDNRRDTAGAVRRRMRPNQEFVKIDQVWGGLQKMSLASLGLNVGQAPSPGQPLPGGVQSGWLATRLALARHEAQGQRAMKFLSQKQKMERHYAALAERVKTTMHAPRLVQGMTGSTRGYDLHREGNSQPGVGIFNPPAIGGAGGSVRIGSGLGARIGSVSRIGGGGHIGGTHRIGSVDRVSPGLRLGQTAKFGVKQRIGVSARFGATQRLSPFQRADAAGDLSKAVIGGQLVIPRATHIGNTQSTNPRAYQNKKIQYHANPTFARPGTIQRFVNSVSGVNSNALIPGPRKVRKPRSFSSHSATSTYGGAAATGAASAGSPQISVQPPIPALYQKLWMIEEVIELRKVMRDAEARAKLRKGLDKRVPAKLLIGAAAGAGAALFGAHAKKEFDESSPATHAIVGAAAGLGTAYLMGRTRARYLARREAGKIFHTGLAAAREHLSPGDHAGLRGAKRAALAAARTHRTSKLSSWRPNRAGLALGAAAGATAALPSQQPDNT